MEDIARWLTNDAPHNGVKELFAAFCQQIVRSCMPVGRASLGLEVLRPEVSGWQQAEAQACLNSRARPDGHWRAGARGDCRHTFRG